MVVGVAMYNRIEKVNGVEKEGENVEMEVEVEQEVSILQVQMQIGERGMVHNTSF